MEKPGTEGNPCQGCLHYYGAYEGNRCCNYIFDTGKRRPCGPGEACTVKEPPDGQKPRKQRKGGGIY